MKITKVEKMILMITVTLVVVIVVSGIVILCAIDDAGGVRAVSIGAGKGIK